MSEEILVEVRNYIGHLTLNRPAALNALTLGMVRGMHAQLKAWAGDPTIHAVLVRGAGEKAFCAGGDIRALYDSHKNGGKLQSEFFVEEYDLDLYIHQYPKPYIALMDGIVMGGGMGISQGAAFRIVTDRTKLAMPEVGIGFFPDVGGSYFLSRLPGALGLYLGITGVQIRAADVLYSELADWYLPAERLASFYQRLEKLEWSSDPRSDLHSVLQETAVDTLPDAPLSKLREVIDEHFSLPSIPEILASLATESRNGYAQWATETAAIMAKRSPTAMCVTHEQLRRGRTLPLPACFRMELGMTRETFRQGDFVEGVRALIVDKDNAPRWTPPALADVTRDSVQRYFAG